jgi:hypothetical protein
MGLLIFLLSRDTAVLGGSFANHSFNMHSPEWPIFLSISHFAGDPNCSQTVSMQK